MYRKHSNCALSTLKKLVSILPDDGYFIVIGILIGVFIPLHKMHPEYFKIIVVGLGFVVVAPGYICSKIEKKAWGRVASKGSVIFYLKHNHQLFIEGSDIASFWLLLIFSLILHILIGVLISQAVLILLGQ